MIDGRMTDPEMNGEEMLRSLSANNKSSEVTHKEPPDIPIDQLLEKGYASMTKEIIPGKLSVRIKTLTAEELQYCSAFVPKKIKEMGAIEPVLVQTYNSVTTTAYVAAAILEINGEVFKYPDNAGVELPVPDSFPYTGSFKGKEMEILAHKYSQIARYPNVLIDVMATYYNEMTQAIADVFNSKDDLKNS